MKSLKSISHVREGTGIDPQVSEVSKQKVAPLSRPMASHPDWTISHDGVNSAVHLHHKKSGTTLTARQNADQTHSIHQDGRVLGVYPSRGSLMDGLKDIFHSMQDKPEVHSTVIPSNPRHAKYFQNKLKTQKAEPSPSKGVHQPAIKEAPGKSAAGFDAREGLTHHAAQAHKKVIREQKLMPRPKLPKSENILNDLHKAESFLKAWKDKMKGGAADKKRPCDFNQKDLKAGIKEEMKDHTKSKHIATEIVMDHMVKDPKAYKNPKKE